jgi:hypothetical protein
MQDGGFAFLAVDEHGRMFRRTEISFHLLGTTPVEGVDALLNGRVSTQIF